MIHYAALGLVCALPLAGTLSGARQMQTEAPPGAMRMGALDAWNAGYRGEGQTVAVIDRGFAGADESAALGELPPMTGIQTVNLNGAYGLEGDSAGKPNAHGTRVAEIVYDVAPMAKLIFISYNTEEEFIQAAAWVAERKIPVVVHSNSFLTPPFDGTGPMAKAVDRAAARGVAWFNSAGNFGQRHWAGEFRPDASGQMTLPLPIKNGDLVYMQLSWSAATSKYTPVVQSQQPDRTWRNELEPSERQALGARLGYWTVPGDGPYRLVITKDAGPAGEQLNLVSRTHGFGLMTIREGSILTPSDAKGAIAVGGLKGLSDRLIDVSSYGPLPDGTIKPDLVAPSELSTGMTQAGGTSAAAPHAAGAAVLIRQRMMSQSGGVAPSPWALRAEMTRTARDLGEMGPDNQYGHGAARIDATPPALVIRPALRRMTAIATDAGRVQQIRILRGRAALKTVRAARVSLGAAVCRGAVQVEVTDWAGNVTRRALTRAERTKACGRARR